MAAVNNDAASCSLESVYDSLLIIVDRKDAFLRDVIFSRKRCDQKGAKELNSLSAIFPRSFKFLS